MARVRLPYSVVLSVLGGVLAAQVLWLGWRPVSRETWLLENLLVVVLVGVLALTHRRLPLSRLCYPKIFVFLTQHEGGAQFTKKRDP
jgi:putative membrane protein